MTAAASFSYKLAAVASFSYKIGGGGLIFLQNLQRRAASFALKIGGVGGLIFLQNWRRRQGFGNITGGCSDMVWKLDSHPKTLISHAYPFVVSYS